MHPFALASANDPATAIAAHADDPELAFIAGGTDLIGLMKDRAALPIEALPAGGCLHPPPAHAATAYGNERVYGSPLRLSRQFPQHPPSPVRKWPAGSGASH